MPFYELRGNSYLRFKKKPRVFLAVEQNAGIDHSDCFNYKITPTVKLNEPKKKIKMISSISKLFPFFVSRTSYFILLSIETVNRALGFSEYAEFVLVLVPPTNIMTLSRDGTPVTPELDWRRPSWVSIPDQDGNRWGLMIGKTGLWTRRASCWWNRLD